METNNYTNFEDIKRELKVLHLERQIAAEELNSLGLEVKESFKPNHLIAATFNRFKDFGIYYLIKRLFTK